MCISVIVFSILTTTKDPGIIPRYPILRALNNGIIPEKFAKPVIDQPGDQLDSGKKFCNTCKIWRPERASH